MPTCDLKKQKLSEKSMDEISKAVKNTSGMLMEMKLELYLYWIPVLF